MKEHITLILTALCTYPSPSACKTCYPQVPCAVLAHSLMLHPKPNPSWAEPAPAPGGAARGGQECLVSLGQLFRHPNAPYKCTENELGISLRDLALHADIFFMFFLHIKARIDGVGSSRARDLGFGIHRMSGHRMRNLASGFLLLFWWIAAAAQQSFQFFFCSSIEGIGKLLVPVILSARMSSTTGFMCPGDPKFRQFILFSCICPMPALQPPTQTLLFRPLCVNCFLRSEKVSLHRRY